MNDASLLESLRALMLPDWRCESDPHVDHLYSIVLDDPSLDGPGGARHRLCLGEETIRVVAEVDELLEELRRSLHIQIGAHARDHIFVHAGVVGWQGRAIVMPGRSYSGKSTLVKAMLDAGADYYSDEFAVLDSSGQVFSYPRALALRQELGPPRRLTARELGWRDTLQPLPLGAIVVTLFCPGARWSAVEMTAGHAVVELFANTVSAQTNTAFAVETLVRATQGALALKSERGEANAAAPMVLNYLGREWHSR